MKKSKIIAWCTLFLLLFIAPQLIFTIGDFENTATNENRTMAEFPKLSLSALESFPTGFDAFYNDRLPFRNTIIATNSYINYALFKESPVSKVIIGKENWLFYNPKGADGDNIKDLNGEYYFEESSLATITAHLVDIEAKLAAQGKEFVIMIIPNKESMYGNQYLPDSYTTENSYTTSDQVVDYLHEHSNLRIVYPKDAINNAISQFPDIDFYYNTDTHWNSLGGYIGTDCLLNELGYDLEDLKADNILHNESDVGKDLAAMMNLEDKVLEENDYYYKYEPSSTILTSFEDFSTEYRYTTDSSNDKKLFVIRDSYGSALSPHIAYPFSETVMVHSNFYTPDMISKENPDIVVFQVVERYLYRLGTFTIE